MSVHISEGGKITLIQVGKLTLIFGIRPSRTLGYFTDRKLVLPRSPDFLLEYSCSREPPGKVRASLQPHVSPRHVPALPTLDVQLIVLTLVGTWNCLLLPHLFQEPAKQDSNESQHDQREDDRDHRVPFEERG